MQGARWQQDRTE
uniref:Uncharacterized protein n=1 Tax=Arundo donax TaxID=35708 RepID=A0A0A8YHV3_ARUDO